MMLGTHAALPVIGVTSLEIMRLSNNQDRLLSNWQLFFIGIGGVLPDLLWPHFSMQGRLNSYTHTLWFIILLIPITYFISKRFYSKNINFFTFSFVSAALLHIATDGISGGVSFIYPIEGVWGIWLVPFKLWMYADLTFLLLMISLIFVRHKFAKNRLSKIAVMSNKK